MSTHSILLHPRTAERIRQLSTHLPQAMILTGPAGVGLHTIARHIAGQTLLEDIAPRDKKGDYSPTAPIAIEHIRELYRITRGKHTRAQFVIIDNAEQMTHAAQNALLKLLEEPTPHVHFILTSHVPHQLLPTILSRVTTVDILPISASQTTALLDRLSVRDTAAIAQLQFAAMGLPAAIIRLVDQPASLDQLRTIMGDAREFLAGSSYDRLRIAIRHQASRDDALQFVDAIQRLLAHSLATRADSTPLTLLDRSLDSYEQLLANRNVKLQLLRLVV